MDTNGRNSLITCSACGATNTRITRGSYAYKESGLDNITLEDVELIHCDECGNEDPIIRAIDTLHSLIADALISKPARLSGREVRFLRKHLELSAKSLARILQVHQATMSKWENGEDYIGPQSDLLIRALAVAKSEGKLDELCEKLGSFDSEGSIPGITCNPSTNAFEYA
jgi:putative zinc finger/helix-turn-helix YgiT family protein